MKYLLVFLSLLICSVSFSQTKIDDYVTITFDEEPAIIDTTIDKTPMLVALVNGYTENYLVSRMKLGSKDAILEDLPFDSKSLDKCYQAVIKGEHKSMAEAGYENFKVLKIKVRGYDCYKVTYTNSTTNKQNVEIINLILEEHFYNFSYISDDYFDRANKNRFFKSIEIDKSNSPSQFVGHSKEYKQGYIIGKVLIYGGLGLTAIIFWFWKKKKKKTN